MLKISASEIACLNSNVHTGGGTDVTEKLQDFLDKAPEYGGVHLVMDGAALVRGLKIHSNTTIECVNSDCGFFMADYANRPIISNYNWSFDKITTRNIKLIGGTYNHNCTKQVHHLPPEEFPFPESDRENLYASGHGIFLMELYGVENLHLDGITFKNQRTYAFCLGHFKNVLIENSVIDMAEHVHPSNQDGLHFFGPGRFLTIRNLRGCTGDDFINLAPDEADGVSDITDVLIDGVFFDDVCQGIRMLSRKNGRLDRVTLKNITGTYRTFAFSIMPFVRGETFGNYGDILIENVSLTQTEATFHYTPLSFMELGGNIENFTLKNVRFQNPCRNSLFIDLGRPFFYRPKELTAQEIKKYQIHDVEYLTESIYWMPENKRPVIKNFTLDNVVFSSDNSTDDMNYISLKHNIENLMIRNIKLFRGGTAKTSGSFIKMANEAKVENMFLENIYAEKIESIVCGNEEHKINLLRADNIILKDGIKAFDTDKVSVNKEIKDDIYEI
ncbi:MAG: hypothetical protein IKJ68_12955 [Clostridia bacterium]|nr:hypothetical protein [Clostridia bacterium]